MLCVKPRLLPCISALSLLVCAVTVVLWVRSYLRTDLVTIVSTRVHRALSGGGGLFFQSLVFEREDGSWWNPSLPPLRQTIDYNSWESAIPRRAAPRGWITAPYRGRTGLVGLSWGGDLNRAVPHLQSISKMREQTFNNADGKLVTFRLVGWQLWIPYWIVFVVSAVPPVYLLTRRVSRPSDGVPCRACGYDLRASNDRCPECGTPIPRIAGANA